MSGLEGDAGYIYQRKVVLLHLLRAISRSRFLGCDIEVEYVLSDDDGDVTASVDFRIREFDSRTTATIVTLVEVKSGDNIRGKTELKGVIRRFLDIEMSPPEPGVDRHYKLAYACEPSKWISGISENEIDDRVKMLERIIGRPEGVDLADFARRLFVERIPAHCDPVLPDDDVTLRSLAYVANILVALQPGDLHRPTARVYAAIRRALEDRIQRYAIILADARRYSVRSTSVPTTTAVCVGDLFGAEGSFFDICIVPGEGRDETIRLMSTRLRIPESELRKFSYE
jgi:hypothetical protein